RDFHVTGVQTCALPISEVQRQSKGLYNAIQMALFQVGAKDIVLMPRDATSADPQVIQGVAEDAVRDGAVAVIGPIFAQQVPAVRSEERRVGKEGGSRWW